jgi:hypothetical protein
MDNDKGESDTASDPQVAGARQTGGVPDDAAADQASTTGTTETPEYVGRIAGDDVGYAGETGAERRAEADRTSNGTIEDDAAKDVENDPAS